jgi:hypothetical protein
MTKTKAATPRAKLLTILGAMPDEAFGWFLVWAGLNGFPDGLGGFQPASRKSIDALRKEARRLLGA